MSGSDEMNNYIFTRLKVKVPPLEYQSPGTNITTARQANLRVVITELLKEWQSADPDVRLAPWSCSDDSNPNLPLKKGGTGSEVLVHQGVAPKYFSELNWAIKKEHELWFHMRIRHSEPMDVLLLYQRPEGLVLYVDRLQSSETAVPGGFFVYSIKAYVNSQSFHQALRTALLQSSGVEFDFALFWGQVKCKQLSLNGPFAMQLEVDGQHYDELRAALAFLYNKEKYYPLGIKMVYIPPPSRCVDSRVVFTACDNQHQFGVHARVQEFRSFRHTYALSQSLPLKPVHQAVADKQVNDVSMPAADESDQSHDSSSQDISTTVDHKTLPELFQTITLENKLVFHSVLAERDHRGQVLYLVIPPGARYDYAQMVIKSPVAYFSQILADPTLETVFNAQSLKAGQSEAFDPKTNMVVNTVEVDATSAMASFVFEFPSNFNPRSSLQATPRFSDTFSFTAGSIQTMNKKQKVAAAQSNIARSPAAQNVSDSQPTVRFPEAYFKFYGVPGPSHQGTGEKK